MPNLIKTPMQMMYENAHLPHYGAGGQVAEDILKQFGNRIQQAIRQYTRATGKAPSAEEVKQLEDHIVSLAKPTPKPVQTPARTAAQEPFANQLVDRNGRPYSPAVHPTTGAVTTPEAAKGYEMRDQFGMTPSNIAAREYAPPHVNAFPEDDFMSMANTGRTSNRTWNKSYTPSTEELAARQQMGEMAPELPEEAGGLGALRTTEGDIPQMTSASEPFATQAGALEAPSMDRLSDEIMLGKHDKLIDQAIQSFRLHGIEPDHEDVLNAVHASINPLRHDYTGMNPISQRPSGRQGIEDWRDLARASGLPETVVSKHPSDWKPQHQREYLLDTTPEQRGSFAKDWDINELKDKRRSEIPQKAAGGMMRSTRDMQAALMMGGRR
jgi:hypothetical protein